MDKIKKIIYGISTIIVIPCLIYYNSRFFITKELYFGDGYLIPFTIIVSLIIGTYIIDYILFRKIDKLQAIIIKQGEELNVRLIKNHFSEIEYIKNNRECILDMKGNSKNVRK